jgi:hypothetical protein
MTTNVSAEQTSASATMPASATMTTNVSAEQTSASATMPASATGPANTTMMTAVETERVIVTAAVVHEELEEQISVCGRKKQTKRFKSGWTLMADKTFVAPDGTKFDTRREAAKYFSKKMPRLEPERKDGWGVYVDASNTHTNFVAPDGEVFNSYVQAMGYAEKSEQPMYGKDGLTVPLTSFFGKSTKPKKTSGTRNNPIDFAQHEEPIPSPTHTPPPTTGKPPSTTQTPSKSLRSPKNQFRIPKQSDQAAELQKLCQRAAVHRQRREKKKAEAVADTYLKSYTVKRIVSRNMHTRVGIMCVEVCACVCVWMSTLTFVFFHSDRENGDPIYIHLWQHLGHDCDFCKGASDS